MNPDGQLLVDLHTHLVRNIVRLNGREPLDFSVSAVSPADVCVRGANVAVFYPAKAWISKFVRHLLTGYFDAARSSIPITRR